LCDFLSMADLRYSKPPTIYQTQVDRQTPRRQLKHAKHYKLLHLKIDTFVTLAIANVYIIFELCTLFFFRTSCPCGIDRQTDRRARPIIRPVRTVT